MPKNTGINNAQIVKLIQGDDAIGAHTQDDAFSFGSLADPAFGPSGPWWGNGNPITNYNLTDNASLDLQTGLKFHLRGGADLTPTGSAGANGMQTYSVAAGPQPDTDNRSSFNLDYVVNTAAGIDPNDTFDLTNAPGLAAYDFKMQITQSGPFVHSASPAIFDLDAASHLWVDEKTGLAFGGDDFDGHTLSDTLKAHLSENSENFGFAPFVAEFGAVAQSTAAGESYDIKLAGFHAGTPQMVSFTHDVINLVAPA